MKNKKNKNLWGLLLAMALFVGCSDESKNKLPDNPALVLDKHEVVLLEATGNTGKVEILSNVSWMALRGSDAQWVKVSPEQGEASSDAMVVTFSADANTGTAERKALIRIVHSQGSREDSVVVLQPGKIAEPHRLQDSLALVALYNATKGYNWKGKWNLKVPIHEWGGVATDIKNGELRVTEVVLADNGLVGDKFPEELAQLSELRKLVITYSKLACEIPEFFGELKNLNFLALNYNGHTGELPASLYTLTKLETLHLYGNALSGQLSPDLGNLNKMEDLNLESNQFSGPIPASIGKMTELFGLMLNSNKFTLLPAEISNCKKLENLVVSTNEINQEIGDMFDELPVLEHLWLNENQFHGKLPELKGCGKLYDLRFSYNKGLDSELPVSWVTNIPELEVFAAYDCGLQGSIPDEYAGFKKLADIGLNGNKLSGTIPAFMRKMRIADLGNNQFTDAAPDFINKNMVSNLNISGNLLSGDWSALFNSVSFVTLQMADMPQVTGKLPKTSTNNMYDGIQTLDLSGTGIDGDIPEALFTNNLTDLNLANCKLTGNLPARILVLSKLVTLKVNGNHLSGNIDPQVKLNANWNKWKPSENICPQRNGVTLGNCDN